MDIACRFLSVCHRFVSLDIEGIFFGLHPSNLAQHIAHIQSLYWTVNCLDRHIFCDLCCKRMSLGNFDIFYFHNPKNLDSRKKCIFHFTQKEFPMDKHKQPWICWKCKLAGTLNIRISTHSSTLGLSKWYIDWEITICMVLSKGRHTFFDKSHIQKFKDKKDMISFDRPRNLEDCNQCILSQSCKYLLDRRILRL